MAATGFTVTSFSSSTNSTLASSTELIASHIASVEKKICEQATYFEPELEKYITYACGSSGKRLRPTLALLSGGSTGAISQEHIDLAVILEMIHIASLVHDDIMDGAELRRERPTLNARWGNALTVLVGDVLFAQALRMATQFSQADFCRRIADAAIGVCSGEMLQTQHRFDSTLSLVDYYRIVAMKTGSLFAVACELGAAFNQASPEIVTALKNYGNNIGVAYQILDDCIDLIGDEKNSGKTLGTDLAGGKFTLPVLMLLELASKEQKEHLHALLFHEKEENPNELMTLLVEQGALAAAKKEALTLVAQAETELAILPESQYKTALLGVAGYLKASLISCSSS